MKHVNNVNISSNLILTFSFFQLPEKTQRDDFSIEKSLTEEHFLKKESSDSSGLEHFNQDHCIFRSHQNNTEKKHNGVKKDHRELHLGENFYNPF